METTKYVRKPLYVDAVQVSVQNFGEIAEWTRGTVVNTNGTQVEALNPSEQFIQLQVSNPRSIRETKAYVGDWVCVGEKGGFKIYLEKAFKFTFDKAPEEVEEHPQAAILKGPKLTNPEKGKGEPEQVVVQEDVQTGNVFENDTAASQVSDPDPMAVPDEPSTGATGAMEHAQQETSPNA